MITHGAYGLRLAANRRISSLPVVPADAAPMGADVTVLFGVQPVAQYILTSAVPLYSGGDKTEDGRPWLEVWRLEDGTRLAYRYADGTEFVIDRAGTQIAAWSPLPHREVLSYFLGPIMGVVLRLRGLTCLHASAVAIDGRAVAFVGASGAGKSSTAAALARMGYPGLTDDIVPLVHAGTAWMAQPGYPRIRLWPPAIEALAGVPSRLPLRPRRFDSERFCLDLTRDGHAFQTTPLPLGMIYLLDPRVDDPGAPHFTPVPPATALLALVAETFATRVQDSALRAAEFETLSRVVSTVPVRRIQPHVDPRGLGQLCAAIVEDCTAHWRVQD
jgi:hypothetical protein